MGNIMLKTKLPRSCEGQPESVILRKKTDTSESKYRNEGNNSFSLDSSEFCNFSLACAMKEGHNGYNLNTIQEN